MVEVELKFQVPDLKDFRKRLENKNVHSGPVSYQRDVYFHHNLHDFVKNDLALRIRNSDGKFTLTFKGPNQDETAKIRREIEVDLPDEQAVQNMQSIFEGCGFFVRAEVEKQRETFVWKLDGDNVQVCLDEVKGLGAFVELELIVDTENDQGAIESAKDRLLEMAKSLGLADPIVTSYLHLLLK